jgi:hypothetical protein
MSWGGKLALSHFLLVASVLIRVRCNLDSSVDRARVGY